MYSKKRIYDFILAKDVAMAFIRALDKKLEGIYNLGFGNKIEVSEIVKAFSMITKKEINFLINKKENSGGFLDCNKLFDFISY